MSNTMIHQVPAYLLSGSTGVVRVNDPEANIAMLNSSTRRFTSLRAGRSLLTWRLLLDVNNNLEQDEVLTQAMKSLSSRYVVLSLEENSPTHELPPLHLAVQEFTLIDVQKEARDD